MTEGDGRIQARGSARIPRIRMGLVGRYLRLRRLVWWPASDAHRDRLIAWLVDLADPQLSPKAED